MTAEIRVDPMTGRMIAVAPHRRSRVKARPAEIPQTGRTCPFCPGHEGETEATIAAHPAEGSWQIRVVRNKWPLFSPPAGDHEVVIESREHDLDLPDFGAEHAGDLIRVWRDRVLALGARADVRHVTLFRNRGRRSGSSEPHPHSQIVAQPQVPPEIDLRESLSRAHSARDGGRSLLAARLADDLADGRRIVARERGFVVLCPYAPHRPYETWIAHEDPDRGIPRRFAEIDDATAAALGLVLVRTAGAVARATGGVDYNVVLRQIPSSWSMELHPRLGGEAGFELESGIHIIVVGPEESAEEIRQSFGSLGSGLPDLVGSG
jgi:UDPglucose--hexose-1-phosphate uridylyltransferase